MRWLGVLGLVVAAFVAIGLFDAPAEAEAGATAPVTPATPAPYLVHQRFRLQESNGVEYTPNAMNFAARTSPDSPLLLFLPATRERPSNYTAFLDTARERGFHVLALDYWNNGASVEATCGAIPTCYTDVQRNRLTGEHPTVYSAVDPTNSIVNRLKTAIFHLTQSDPTGGWGRFAGRRGIDWDNIVFAGHSQGGGESAYIAHIHRVLGVLMFSSPVDSDNGVNASWMGSPGATSPSREFGFDDTGDIFSARIQASWDAMGLDRFGAPVNVGHGIPAGSHELLTTAHLGTPMQSHSFEITDRTPRRPDGQPLFENVWKWMLAQVWIATPIGIS